MKINIPAKDGSRPGNDQSMPGAKTSDGKKEIIVISLGGSLIVPDQIDYVFLKKFSRLIFGQLKLDKKFILICGGGKTARSYQVAAKKIGRLLSEDIDWLGIHSTRLNAHLLRSIFVRVAHKKIVKPIDAVVFKEQVLVAAGWKPGNSTDYCAVLLAKKYHSKKILNLSNIDYVFDRDPRLDKKAKPIEKISWTHFRRLIPKKWSPGLNSPFDPVASKVAQKFGLEVAIINGRDLKSVENYLSAKKFKGTIIS